MQEHRQSSEMKPNIRDKLSQTCQLRTNICSTISPRTVQRVDGSCSSTNFWVNPVARKRCKHALHLISRPAKRKIPKHLRAQNSDDLFSYLCCAVSVDACLCLAGDGCSSLFCLDSVLPFLYWPGLTFISCIGLRYSNMSSNIFLRFYCLPHDIFCC